MGCEDICKSCTFAPVLTMVCRRSVVTSWNKDNSKGKELMLNQDNFAFLFWKQDENGNFLLFLTASLNLTTISHYWSISEKEIILCGNSTFKGFGKVSEGLGSSVRYVYTVRSHLRETDWSWCEQYRLNISAVVPFKVILSSPPRWNTFFQWCCHCYSFTLNSAWLLQK